MTLPGDHIAKIPSATLKNGCDVRPRRRPYHECRSRRRLAVPSCCRHLLYFTRSRRSRAREARTAYYRNGKAWRARQGPSAPGCSPSLGPNQIWLNKIQEVRSLTRFRASSAVAAVTPSRRLRFPGGRAASGAVGNTVERPTRLIKKLYGRGNAHSASTRALWSGLRTQPALQWLEALTLGARAARGGASCRIRGTRRGSIHGGAPRAARHADVAV